MEQKRVASEPPGEGAVIIDICYYVDDIIVDIDGNSGVSYDSFVKICSSDIDLGRQIRILGVALVEYIDNRSMFGLDTTTNR